MKVKLTPETSLHISFCDWLRMQYTGICIHHSPNEAKRGHFAQWLMKRMRVSSGFPDIFLIYRGKAIAVELKAEKRSKRTGKKIQALKPTENQKAWIGVMESAGIQAACCTGIEEAMDFVRKHFNPLRKPPGDK